MVGITELTSAPAASAVTLTVSFTAATGSATCSTGELPEATMTASATVPNPLWLTRNVYSPKGTAAKWKSPFAAVRAWNTDADPRACSSTSAAGNGRCCTSCTTPETSANRVACAAVPNATAMASRKPAARLCRNHLRPVHHLACSRWGSRCAWHIMLSPICWLSKARRRPRHRYPKALGDSGRSAANSLRQEEKGEVRACAATARAPAGARTAPGLPGPRQRGNRSAQQIRPAATPRPHGGLR